MNPRGLVVWAGVALAMLAGSPAPRWEVYAVRYGALPAFRVSSLVASPAAGADRERALDIAMMVWVLRGPDGRIE